MSKVEKKMITLKGGSLAQLAAVSAFIVAVVVAAMFFLVPMADAADVDAGRTETVVITAEADPVPRAPDWWAGNPDIACKALPVVDGKWLCYNIVEDEVEEAVTAPTESATLLEKVLGPTDTE